MVMGIFGQGLGGIGNVLSVLLPFLFVLTIVVFIHELGHFLVARWCGVKVKAFSIGFGREIFGFYDRYGTRWRFAWIPLGRLRQVPRRREQRQRALQGGPGEA